MRLDRQHLSDLHGVARLACDATMGVTDIVERMHRTVQLRPGPLGRKAADRTGGITGLVYRSVRGGAWLVGKGIDAGLGPLAALLPPAAAGGPGRDAWVAALNGVYGDHLARSGNLLATPMSLWHRGSRVDPDDPSALPGLPPRDKLLVLVHGLCMNDRQWLRDGHDHGAALADALGSVPLYLRYNSGQPIAANGRALADLLERLIAGWPAPLRELVIIGHSMGGLVARSACAHADSSGQNWIAQLSKVVFLGTPHHGAPLERGGHGLDVLLNLSPWSAPIGRIGQSRSAGIRDLRDGRITRRAAAPVPLSPGVACYAAAASLANARSALRERLIGDGLVPLNSALGIHPDAARDLGIPAERQWVGYGTGHLGLLGHRGLFTQLGEWLG